MENVEPTVQYICDRTTDGDEVLEFMGNTLTFHVEKDGCSARVVKAFLEQALATQQEKFKKRIKELEIELAHYTHGNQIKEVHIDEGILLEKEKRIKELNWRVKTLEKSNHLSLSMEKRIEELVKAGDGLYGWIVDSDNIPDWIDNWQRVRGGK